MNTKGDEHGKLKLRIRIPTPIQMDWQMKILGLNTPVLRTYSKCKIKKEQREITGHWRNQLKEEIRLDLSKSAAKKDKLM